MTALEPGELVREVQVPILAPSTGWSFVEFVRRAGDFALVEAAAVVELDAESSVCRRVELVVGGVSDRPLRLDEAASLVVGGGAEPAIRGAAELARELVEPVGSEHASADYRRHLTGVLTQRALTEALLRARSRSDLV